MSQSININTNMPERQRTNQSIQQSIMMYLEQPERNIRNKGYINTVKASFNTRILSINTCGFKPSNEEKIQMMINIYKRLSIDILLLNETNMKWTLWN